MDKANYTIIRESGRTDFVADASYFTILTSVSTEYRSAGGNWDRPNMLLRNGKIVVTEGLSEIAWQYGKRSQELYDEMLKKIQQEFQPEWSIGLAAKH